MNWKSLLKCRLFYKDPSFEKWRVRWIVCGIFVNPDLVFVRFSRMTCVLKNLTNTLSLRSRKSSIDDFGFISDFSSVGIPLGKSDFRMLLRAACPVSGFWRIGKTRRASRSQSSEQKNYPQFVKIIFFYTIFTLHLIKGLLIKCSILYS